jgi:hypothetical protein
MQRVSLSLLIVLVCLLSARPVHAGNCSNPTGHEADIIYNGAAHTPQFCNGTTWMAMGAIGSTGGLMLISTQAASNSASLQFTNLPTYNTFLLNCNGLQPSVNYASLELQFGEGSTPTWETSSYAYSIFDANDSNNDGYGMEASSSASGIFLDWAGGNVSDSSTAEENLQVWINNISTTGIHHAINDTGIFFTGTATYVQIFQAAGAYLGDTNAITAIRVLYGGGNSGNITAGQCSLYGMN